MKRWALGLPLVLALMACGSATLSGDVASGARTPSPRGATSAVLVDLTSSATSYKVSLVDTDGGVALSLTGLKRTQIVTHAGTAIQLPYVSTTVSSLYYLDGDSRVRGVRMNAPPPTPLDLAVPSGSEAAFAVSPDDSTIAVSVLDFTVSPVRVTLYTDSLGGGNKHVIYQSSANYVWPVAWHGGLIVLAHAYGPFEESIAPAAPARDNPYSAVSYHLVDPSTADRKILMGACTVSGPLSPAGSGCIQGGSIDWQGKTTDWSTTDWGSRSSAAALSPDGKWMAAANPDDPSEMSIWAADGTILKSIPGPGLHDWAGWIDGQTLLVGGEGQDWQPQVSHPFAGGEAVVVDARGFFAALFPTNIV